MRSGSSCRQCHAHTDRILPKSALRAYIHEASEHELLSTNVFLAAVITADFLYDIYLQNTNGLLS